VCAVRLAPYVYGCGGSDIRLLMQISLNNGEVIYVNDKGARTSTINSNDDGRLFLLAAKEAKAGDVFNATSFADLTARQITETMGLSLNIPVRSLTFEETASKTGKFLAKFLSSENCALNAKAIRELG
jgi:hypothetical protein